MPTLPTEPTSTVDTTYSLPTGTTHVCTTAGQFSTALTNAALNDVIQLQAGNTFAGPFTLPNKTSGSGWIYIVSSAVGSLPEGTRVGPSDAGNMAKITVSSDATSITSANTAHHLRFVGIEISGIGNNVALVNLGSHGETSMANQPHDITFDRCYIHGNTTSNVRRGLRFHGNSLAAIECYISEILETGTGADCQAIWCSNCDGPIKIVNNYLEGSTENLHFGGSHQSIQDVIPSDITIQRNHFYKPLSWRGAGHNVKNLLEFKCAQRVLVEGNRFENNWADGQNGFSLLLTPRNEGKINDSDALATWTYVRDVTIRKNKFINICQGISILGSDTINASQITQRILIENNVAEITRLDNSGGNTGDGHCFQLLPKGAPTDFTIRHNTFLILNAGGNSGVGLTDSSYAGSPDITNFNFRDNIISNGTWGFYGAGDGNGTFAACYDSADFRFGWNAIIGMTGTYTNTGGRDASGNFAPANVAAINFVDYAGGDYTLNQSTSIYRAGQSNDASDGLDNGADIAAIDAAYAGEVGSSGSSSLVFGSNAVITASGLRHVAGIATEVFGSVANPNALGVNRVNGVGSNVFSQSATLSFRPYTHIAGSSVSSFLSVALLLPKGTLRTVASFTFAGTNILRGRGRLSLTTPFAFAHLSMLRGRGRMIGIDPFGFGGSATLHSSTATVTQEGWWFRDDNGTEVTATYRGAQDSDVQIPVDTPVRVRVLLDASGGNPLATRFRLEYKKSTDLQYQGVALNDGALRLIDSPNISSGGEITTPQLAPPIGKTTANFKAGKIRDDANGADVIDLNTGEYTEQEWCVIAPASQAAKPDRFNLRVARG